MAGSARRTEVTKTYSRGPPHEVPVLRGASRFRSRRGEVVALEGPSGSGKTTLSVHSGLSAGRQRRPGDDRRAGGRCPAPRPAPGNPPPLDRLCLPAVQPLSVADRVRERPVRPEYSGLAWPQGSSRGRSRARCRRALANRRTFRPRDLSGGQRQRVAIARALAGGAPLVLADEPTGNLDSESGSQVLELFRGLSKSENRSLMIVTHDPSVRSIADRVLAMRDGSLVCTEN